MRFEAEAQIDPTPRQLIELAYNQPLEGRAPIAAYGFYYYNHPGFFRTNLTLRLAVAPVYVDSELGFTGLLGPNTDLGVGIAGGGFADTYSEIRQGTYRRPESFVGHGAEASISLYHRFNPEGRVPLNWVSRISPHYSIYDEDDATAANFAIPDDLAQVRFRNGLRWGGREPTMTSPLAFELSLWHETALRSEVSRYGFAGDRVLERDTHLFWGRALLKYTFEETQQYFDIGTTLGTSVAEDRFSAYRIGGMLPFVSEFPLSIPGYYFQELSAERFALLNAEYSFPFTPGKSWRLNFHGATAVIDDLDGFNEKTWHSGLAAGITYLSPKRAWLVSIMYGHGFQALRHGDEGAHQVSLLFQYDLDASGHPFRFFSPNVTPYGSRGGERLLK